MAYNSNVQFHLHVSVNNRFDGLIQHLKAMRDWDVNVMQLSTGQISLRNIRAKYYAILKYKNSRENRLNWLSWKHSWLTRKQIWNIVAKCHFDRHRLIHLKFIIACTWLLIRVIHSFYGKKLLFRRIFAPNSIQLPLTNDQNTHLLSLRQTVYYSNNWPFWR